MKDNITVTHKGYEGQTVRQATASGRTVTGDPLTDLDASLAMILRRAGVNLDKARAAHIYIIVADGEEEERDAA